MLTLTLAMLTYIVLLRWQLREARRWQMRLAERIYAAHEVLGRRAERKGS